MNHIARLTRDREIANAELVALYAGIAELETYLSSNKFTSDPIQTVSVRDVLNRIHDARQQAIAAHFATVDAARAAEAVAS